MNRRRFLYSSSAAVAGGALLTSCGKEAAAESAYGISLAQWSQHVALRGGDLDNLDWPAYVTEKFGISALEWVNSFFADQHDSLGIQPKGGVDGDYMKQLKQRQEDAGAQTLLIMCDRVGQLGNPDATKRKLAVEGHYAWLEASKFLGGHSIRVNASSDGKLPYDEQVKLCADGLGSLSEKAKELGLNVIVENHGGLSSNGAWLAKVMETVGMDNCGTLPDFGNFYVAKKREGKEKQYEAAKQLYTGDAYSEDDKGLSYDRYQGVKDLMPYAKGVSAKAHDFDADGNEIHTDFAKMAEIVKASGYTGHIGVEYEGKGLSEDEGILATKALIERTFGAKA
ncbi:MAG: TIM barrel protein [Verrucomicrobiota bacterium]